MNLTMKKLNRILTPALSLFAFLFIICGFVKAYHGENSFIYFFLVWCFGAITTGKAAWNRKKLRDMEQQEHTEE